MEGVCVEVAIPACDYIVLQVRRRLPHPLRSLLNIPCVFVYENIPVKLFSATLPTGTDFRNDFI